MCRAGNLQSFTRGADSILGNCTSLPDDASGLYISALCKPGSYDSLGTNTVINKCSNPLRGQFVTNICVSGSSRDNIQGINNLSTTCTIPSQGQYVISPCPSGSYNVTGSDTQVAACPTASCVPGSWNTPGSVIYSTTAAVPSEDLTPTTADKIQVHDASDAQRDSNTMYIAYATILSMVIVRYVSTCFRM